jgi:hypothetical protein
MMHRDIENGNKFIIEELQIIQENIIKRRGEIEKLCKKNNVTLEEIKEISEVMKYGEQIMIENEEHLGVSQTIPMNIGNSVKEKKKKRREKGHRTKERRRELYQTVRKMLEIPNLTNQRVKEFLKNPPDISTSPIEAEIKLFYLLNDKHQREFTKKTPDKPWKSKTKCKGLAELFYEEFVLEKKGVSTRRCLSENCKKFSVKVQWGSLWSLKKVLYPFIMIQGLVGGRRDLNAVDYLPLRLINGKKEEATTGAISFYPARES